MQNLTGLKERIPNDILQVQFERIPIIWSICIELPKPTEKAKTRQNDDFEMASIARILLYTFF